MKIKPSVFLPICLLLTAVYPHKLKSQPLTKPGTGEIGTVQFFRENSPLSFPIIDQTSAQKIELRFDIFGIDKEIFNYKIILCDYNWETVDLDPFDYMEGYEENYLEPFGQSINTMTQYTQYRLKLPNNDVRFLMAGNYKLQIYKDDDENKVILEKRFVIMDEQVSIDVMWDQYQSAIYGEKQEIQAKVKPVYSNFNDLAGNIKLLILKNSDWNTEQWHEKYSTDGSGKFVFDFPGQIVYRAGNEYRFFDAKSLKFMSERVQHIDYKNQNYHVFLKEDQLRGTKQYFSNEDLNGQFFISNQETNDPDTLDAEYMFVHFKLNTGMPLPADVYIEGAITNWDTDKHFMAFKPETGTYEKALFLKQGLYNYRYITKEYDTKKVYWDITEGNHFETVNSYMAIIYYRPLGEMYYYPAGVGVLETR